MKTGFIDFLNFLQDRCALANYLNAVNTETGAKERLEALISGKFASKMAALLFTNVFIWNDSEMGQGYWTEIDKQWREYIGVPTEATSEEFLEIMTDGLITIGR